MSTHEMATPARGSAMPQDAPPASRSAWLVQLGSAALSRGTAMPAVASLLVIAVFFQLQSPHFLSPLNLSNLAVQATLIAVIALGEVIVLLLGEIDLSLGSICGATAAILGVLMTSGNLPWYVAVPGMVLAGALMGAFQGWWIAWLGIPSFVVTLAGMLAFLGLQLFILGPNGTMSVFDPTIAGLTGSWVPVELGTILGIGVALAVAVVVIRSVSSGRRDLRHLAFPVVIAALVIGGLAVFNSAKGIPVAFLALVLMLLLGWWVTQHTTAGRHLFAVGGNAEAARRAGISVVRMRFAAFTLSGAIAAIGGVFAVSYNGSAGTLTGGGTLLLEAIGAAVIGGTSLFGGRGTVWSALFGALIMGGVANGLDLTNADQPVKYMVQGAIVLLAVSMDTILRRRQSRGRLGGIRA